MVDEKRIAEVVTLYSLAIYPDWKRFVELEVSTSANCVVSAQVYTVLSTAAQHYVLSQLIPMATKMGVLSLKVALLVDSHTQWEGSLTTVLSRSQCDIGHTAQLWAAFSGRFWVQRRRCQALEGELYSTNKTPLLSSLPVSPIIIKHINGRLLERLVLEPNYKVRQWYGLRCGKGIAFGGRVQLYRNIRFCPTLRIYPTL